MYVTAHLGQKGIAIDLNKEREREREYEGEYTFEFSNFIALSSAEQYTVTL